MTLMGEACERKIADGSGHPPRSCTSDLGLQAPSLPQSLHEWPRLSLRFTAISQGLQASSHFGSAWHGGIGLWLHERHPLAYQALYEGAADAVKPYLLMPPEADVIGGQSFSMEIKLFGDATRHEMALVSAVEALAEAGVGPGRGRFTLVDVQKSHSPWDTSTGADRAVLEFMTPTLIKADNRFLDTAPDLRVVMQRGLGRLAHLGHVLAPDSKEQLLAVAQRAVLQRADLQWRTSPRYSARQQAWMPFGGLQGSVHYFGVDASLWPWMRVVEYLHLGNKTTFGHGHIKFWPIGGQPNSSSYTCPP